MFGSRGWVVHNETNPFGFTGVHDWPTAFWFPEAGAWLAQHLLRALPVHARRARSCATRAYPVMKELAAVLARRAGRRPARRQAGRLARASRPEHGDVLRGRRRCRSRSCGTCSPTPLEAADDARRRRARSARELRDALGAARPRPAGRLVGPAAGVEGRLGRPDRRPPARLAPVRAAPGRQITPADDAGARRGGARSRSTPAATAAPAGARPGRSTSGPGCSTATTRTRCCREQLTQQHAGQPVGHPPAVPDRRQLRRHRRRRRDAAAEPHRRAARAAGAARAPGRTARSRACGRAATSPSTSAGRAARADEIELTAGQSGRVAVRSALFAGPFRLVDAARDGPCSTSATATASRSAPSATAATSPPRAVYVAVDAPDAVETRSSGAGGCHGDRRG